MDGSILRSAPTGHLKRPCSAMTSLAVCHLSHIQIMFALFRDGLRSVQLHASAHWSPGYISTPAYFCAFLCITTSLDTVLVYAAASTSVSGEALVMKGKLRWCHEPPQMRSQF